jgi:hypothetical protein
MPKNLTKQAKSQLIMRLGKQNRSKFEPEERM